MKPSAIVYTSNTGHTERYASLLSECLSLPFFDVKEAKKKLKKKDNVIYLGWLCAGDVKGYKKYARRYSVCAVVGIGLCDTGTMIDEVRSNARIPLSIPVFTVQGGMDREKLKGINKFMINTITKLVGAASNKSESDERMLYLLKNGGDFVCKENLSAVLAHFEIN